MIDYVSVYKSLLAKYPLPIIDNINFLLESKNWHFAKAILPISKKLNIEMIVDIRLILQSKMSNKIPEKIHEFKIDNIVIHPDRMKDLGIFSQTRDSALLGMDVYVSDVINPIEIFFMMNWDKIKFAQHLIRIYYSIDKQKFCFLRDIRSPENSINLMGFLSFDVKAL
jgi:hypothetical protein